MTNVIRHLHRLSGGAGAGSPGTVAPSGVIAINFDTGAGTPELWSSNGTAWQQLNPPGSVTATTAANIITGSATGEFIEPATLAAAATTISSGGVDSGKYVRLDGVGLLDSTVIPIAAGSDALAGTSNTLFLTPLSLSGAGTIASVGPLDSGRYVRLDANGKLDGSVISVATSGEVTTGTDNSKAITPLALAGASTASSAGAADAGKFVTLDAAGKLDPSILNVEAMEYKGGIDVTAAAPGTPSVGDVYVVTTGGTIDASFTGPAGNPAAVGDLLIYNGTQWDYVAAAAPDLSGYLPLAGTAGVTGAAMASGAVITMTPATAGDTVFDGNGGAIVDCVIDAGTF